MSKRENRATGNLGEQIASKFLIKEGFKILEKNYFKKLGELDIVAQKDKNIYFFEVKTNLVSDSKNIVTRPEERVDRNKLRQIGKAIQVYLSEMDLKELDWYFKVIAIKFDPKEKVARLKVIDDVVPE